MSRARYFGMRVIQTFVLLFIVLTFLFFFFRLLPGDFTDIMMYRGASEETIKAFRDNWGLDDPLHIQYMRYMMNFATGDVGTSLQFRKPVWEFVKMKIFNSFILVAPAITIAYVLGSLIGGVLGSKRGSKLEKYGLVPIILSGSFPSFFTAILLIIVFANWFGWFPTSGMFGFSGQFQGTEFAWWRPYLTADFLMHYILPFTAILFRYIYLPALIMRTNIVEVMGQDFFYYHRMTGLPGVNRLRHLIKNASLPVITLYPVSMTRAIGGLVIIEVVFNWPGIGYTLVQGVLSRDFPVVQFVFFLVAAFVIVANFTVDIAYGVIDPRVSIGED